MLILHNIKIRYVASLHKVKLISQFGVGDEKPDRDSGIEVGYSDGQYRSSNIPPAGVVASLLGEAARMSINIDRAFSVDAKVNLY